jgi:membrane-associated protein
VGAFAWVLIFVVLGHFFGNLPAVRKNFQYVILGIIVLSVLPAAWEILAERRRRASAA